MVLKMAEYCGTFAHASPCNARYTRHPETGICSRPQVKRRECIYSAGSVRKRKVQSLDLQHADQNTTFRKWTVPSNEPNNFTWRLQAAGCDFGGNEASDAATGHSVIFKQFLLIRSIAFTGHHMWRTSTSGCFSSHCCNAGSLNCLHGATEHFMTPGLRSNVFQSWQIFIGFFFLCPKERQDIRKTFLCFSSATPWWYTGKWRCNCIQTSGVDWGGWSV
jgi:hypothetical protein